MGVWIAKLDKKSKLGIEYKLSTFPFLENRFYTFKTIFLPWRKKTKEVST